MSTARRLPLTSPAAVEVLTRILTQGPIPRVEIARRTGLSSAAVTKAVAPLIDAGFVGRSTSAREELARTDPAIGRPVSPLTVVADSISSIGLTVTRSALIGVTTDFRARIQEVRHRRLRDTSAESAVAQLAGLARELIGASTGPLAGIGVAVPGDIDPAAGLVRDSPVLGWRNVPVGALLQESLGVPVVVSNDVQALIVAEHWFGVGVDVGSFAVVTVGAGLGCGLYVNGDVVAGAQGISGGLGHLPLAPDDLRCTCGHRGCVETVAGSAAVLALVRSRTGRPDLTLSEAADLACSGDVRAREAFDRAGEAIGTAVATLANLVGPELVVIAGEGMADHDLYGRRLRQAFADHSFGAAARCRLVLRSHTRADWARGAAAVIIHSYVRGVPPFART